MCSKYLTLFLMRVISASKPFTVPHIFPKLFVISCRGGLSYHDIEVRQTPSDTTCLNSPLIKHRENIGPHPKHCTAITSTYEHKKYTRVTNKSTTSHLASALPKFEEHHATSAKH